MFHIVIRPLVHVLTVPSQIYFSQLLIHTDLSPNFAFHTYLIMSTFHTCLIMSTTLIFYPNVFIHLFFHRPSHIPFSNILSLSVRPGFVALISKPKFS